MVLPDKRKGLVFMKLDNNGLLHFYWKDRQHGRLEDDFIIFPDDAEMKRVPQCTTGRVYLLRFKNNSKRKFFYWMQEPNEAKDADLIKKVNDLINNPPDPSVEGIGDDLPAGLMESGALQSLLGPGADREHLLEMLQSGRFQHMISPMGGSLGGSRAQTSFDGSRPATSQQASASAAATAPTAPSLTGTRSSQHRQQQQQQPRQQLQLSDLQSALSSVGVIIPQGGTADGSREEHPAINLSQVVTSDALRQAVSEPSVAEQLESLLPETGEDPVAIVSSPQFQQALSTFGLALQSGQLGPLVSQFGLGQQAVQAANEGDTVAFTTALQNEMAAGDEGDKLEGEQQMDTGEDQIETGKEGTQKHDDKQQANDDDEDDTMNVE